MSISQLLNSWRRRIRCLKTAHFESADQFATLNGWAGALLIFLSALSTMLALISAHLNGGSDGFYWLMIAAAATGMGTSALAGLQAYFRFSERAERHRTVGAALARLELIVEVSISSAEQPGDPGRAAGGDQPLRDRTQADLANSLADEWARVTNGAPVLSERRYQKHCAKVDACDCHDV